ncbi:type I inositol 1-4-5-trisphosphate 5-phosphatase-like [Brachionus plicatilis]|uniref:inositol-polyphosphate 5-phosphatase n=1 Tax=Brachionus plicatilis TaxID=10195 RepID=A0A3M7RWM9_BRAPC|nr:type I inositol 1-4-5-trisphosphate 5-phosphatase-like [Brachionus plicatilis]
MNSKHSELSSKVLLVTANVGTIFENLDVLLEPWLNEFTNKISVLEPEFIALHMQEIGGKNYKTSMQSVDPFFKKFLSNEIIQQYNKYLIVIDSDFTDDKNFTSLCNVYLIHNNLKDEEVQLYNFSEKYYFNYTSRQIFSGNLNGNHLIFKERFMKHFFTDFQWSRKGFVQTKWKIRNQDIDLVNIHLFHDPSNLVAMKTTPSLYSSNRKRALEYSIKKIKEKNLNGSEQVMFAIFGDFNFRLDLAALVDDFSNKQNLIEFKDNNDKLIKVICKASDDKDVFTIEEKKFKWHYESTIQDVKKDLLKYDIELSLFEEGLYEVERDFPPSYPFMEEFEQPDKYMESRCPAWCDRIIMNKDFMKSIERSSECLEYGMIGENTCMGDHKPIYLFFKLFEQKAHVIDKADPKYSNIIINNINTLAYPLNYTYLNNKLFNFNDLMADFHDNALFNNISLIKHKEQFSKYAQYLIQNLDLVPKPKCPSPKIINLNFWLKSTIEIILQLDCVNAFNCETCALSGLDEKNCDNLEKFVSEKNFFSIFFLNTLNGNFYKFDHLMAYLQNTISELTKSIKTEGKDLVDNLDFFDQSSKSLTTLRTVQRFLTLSCTHKLLKITLYKHTTFKKLLLFNQCHSSYKTNKNIHLKLDDRFLKNSNRYENVNNNDESCIDFNNPK